ncbi:MAG: hypothetical protein M3498_03160 [Deinococcota bacterium]|nr:hypothetical protein [Deinococcota bacterium]
MKRTVIFVITLLSLLAASATAQQAVTVEGFVRMEGEIPENSRVGVHVIDLDGNTLGELTSTGLVAGTFSMTAPQAAVEPLAPLRDGAVPLPGLQSEYRVSPEGVNYARAVTKVYIDNDGSGAYTPGTDAGFVSIATLESGGFYVLLYVDRDATLTGRGATVELRQGWNVFTVQPGDEGELRYAAVSRVDDIVLDTFRP